MLVFYAYFLDMRALPSIHRSKFDNFYKVVTYFTTSRLNSSRSGNWSNMTIELSLKRAMKIHGELTIGRGITVSVLAKWVGGSSVSTIYSALEDFTVVQFSTEEQHVDYRP